MSIRSAIVEYARSLIGTPFHDAARVPGVGVDCAGVLVLAARHCCPFVRPDFDLPPYLSTPDGHTMMEWCNRYMGSPVAKHEMQPGDALVVRTLQYPQHLGVIGGHPRGGLSLIHASNTVNPPRVVETQLVWLPNQRFIAAYCFPGVELWSK